MGQQCLIDSNAVIDFLGGKLPQAGINFMNNIVNDIPKISVMTKIELLGYNAPPSSYQLLVDFIDSSILLDLSSDIVDRTIVLRKSMRIKIPDAIIAATALVFDLELISRNEDDFKGIAGLKLINPWKIK